MESRCGGTLELKICERCGGLWLRPAKTDWRYCRGCLESLKEFPRPMEKQSAEVTQ